VVSLLVHRNGVIFVQGIPAERQSGEPPE